MVFNATFNNISVISWRSVLSVEETGENHRPVVSHRQTLSYNVVSSTPRHERGSNSQRWCIIYIYIYPYVPIHPIFLLIATVKYNIIIYKNNVIIIFNQ